MKFLSNIKQLLFVLLFTLCTNLLCAQKSYLHIIDEEKLYIDPEQTVKDGEFISRNGNYDKGEFYIGLGKYYQGDYLSSLFHLYNIEDKDWRVAAAYFKVAIFQQRLFLNFADDYLELYSKYDPIYFERLKLNQERLYHPKKDFTKEYNQYQKYLPKFSTFLYLESMVDSINYRMDANLPKLENVAKTNYGNYYKAKAAMLASRTFFDNADLNKALEYADLSNEYSLILKNSSLMYENYENLAKIYRIQNNQEALKTIYAPLKASKTLARISEYDTNNAIYNFMNNRSEKFLAKEYNTLLIIITILSITLICLFFIYYFLKYQTKKRKIKQYRLEKLITQEPIISEEKNPIIINIPKKIEYDLIEKLNRFEAQKKFLNPQITLADLAEDFDTNTRYLSEIIFKTKQENYRTYINNLRIKYILNKLQTEPVYLNYKINALAEEAGFMSKSSFINAFKNYTDYTPKIFIKSLTENYKKS